MTLGQRLAQRRMAAPRSRAALRAPGSCAAGPCRPVVRNDSGWNCTPSTGRVLWRSPMISSLRGAAARHLQAVGQARALDQQRVVARRLERARQAGEDAAPVVEDRRGLAVHDLARAHDLAAEGLPDRLVAEAHAQDRDLPGVRRMTSQADPGLVGRARPGRDHDVGRARARRCRRPAISSLRTTRTSCPSSPRYWTRL